jgi:cell division protein FtsN
MKKVIIVLAILVGFQASAQDQKKNYWSLGSFSALINAISEKNRLTDVTGLPVQVATFYDGDRRWYRTVVEKDGSSAQEKKIISVGINPWTLPLSADQLAMVDEELEKTEAQLDEKEYFLVLAGFRADFRADRFLGNLSSEGMDELQIETSSIAGAPWYRVMHGPFNLAQASVSDEIRSHGISDAWWVRRGAEPGDKFERVPVAEIVPLVAVAVAVIEPVIEPIVEPVKVAVIEPVPEPKLDPPKAGESYLDYCVTKANEMEREVYCQDGFFKGLIMAEKKIKDDGLLAGKGGNAITEFCAVQASAAEREIYCANQTQAPVQISSRIIQLTSQ